MNNSKFNSVKRLPVYLREKGLTFSVIISAAVTGYITASLYEVIRSERLVGVTGDSSLRFTSVDFINNVSPVRMVLITLFTGLVLIGAALLISGAAGGNGDGSPAEKGRRQRLISLPVHVSLLLSSAAFAYILSVAASLQSFGTTFFETTTHPQADVVFAVGVSVVMIIIIRYLTDGDKLMLGELSATRFFSSWKTAYLSVALCTAAVSTVFTVFTYCRHLSFSSAAFDFGIFAQMFEKMAETGLPLTTVERTGEMSHFAVHFAPSWYLLLPVYKLFRSPLCLYVLNSVIIALGAFPVFRIAKKSGASPFAAVAFSIVYLFFPSMGAGLFFDIHENSLLPVLILYTVYFFIDGKTVPTLIFAFLTLGVKEDSAVFVASFALYVIFATKRKPFGIVLLILSGIYFYFASGMIEFLGGKVMSFRLEAYYPSGAETKGFLAPVKTVVMDAGYLLKKVFDTDAAVPEAAKSEVLSVGEGKLSFILWMLMPTLFAPFLAKKNASLFLLLPMVLENLMLTWPYQYDIYYQYTYGPAALIVAASVLAVVSMSGNVRKRFLLCSVVICIIMSGSLFWPKALKYSTDYTENKELYDARQAVIDTFLDSYYTKGESVSTTDKAVSHMSKVSDLRMLNSPYEQNNRTDWIVISESDSGEEEYSFLASEYECMNPGDTGDFRIFRKITR